MRLLTAMDDAPVGARDRVVSREPRLHGDHISRAEFERRYWAMPHLKKAELIDGVVYLDLPVPVTHGRASVVLAGRIGVYMSKTPGADSGVHSSVRLDPDTEVQPDVFMSLPRKSPAALLLIRTT